MDLKKLSISEKVGQKFIFGVNLDNIDVIVDLIKNYYIGGVILYKKNYNNYDEMLSVIKRLKEANKDNKIPLFISIDQEGGRVNRMPSEFKNLKNVFDMSKKDVDLIYENGNITGKMLSLSGINMNFSPVMDIDDGRAGKVLFKRCFCGNVHDVSLASMKYIDGLKNNGIISVCKHFPGHGASKIDSHYITPYIFDYDSVLEKHIIPFDNAIKNGVDALMVSHLVIRKLTKGLPASISKSFIKDYIRDRNKFDGLVITDDINMLSRNLLYRFNYVKKSILSGSDIILVRIKKDGSSIIDKCVKMVYNNSEYMKILDDSIERIIRIKEKYNINDDISYDGCNIDEINNEIDKINKMCC